MIAVVVGLRLAETPALDLASNIIHWITSLIPSYPVADVSSFFLVLLPLLPLLFTVLRKMPLPGSYCVFIYSVASCTVGLSHPPKCPLLP